MRHGAHVRLLLPLATGLSACLSAPLGPPGSVPTNVHLLGTWHCVVSDDGEKKETTLEVIRFDDSQYYAEWTGEGKTTRYRAYSTRVGDTTLLNAEELNGRFTPWPWAILRAEVGKDGTLALSMVDGEALRSKDEKAARREIGARVRDVSLFRALATCAEQKD
jgi:hypothetical protein